MRLFLFFALLLLFGLGPAQCTAQVPARRNPVTGRPRSDLELESLVNLLASRIPAPALGSSNLPPAEPRIWAAVDALHEQGVHAFPVLIKHFDDQRYCCCEGDLTKREITYRTVGYVCHRIVELQVGKQVAWKTSDPRRTPGIAGLNVPNRQQTATEWLKTQAGKQLWELQQNSIQRVIKHNEARLAESPDAETRKLCEECIAANQGLASILSTTRVPLPTSPFRPHIER